MRLRPIEGRWIDVFICAGCSEPREGRALVVAGEVPVCHSCVVDALLEIEESGIASEA